MYAEVFRVKNTDFCPFALKCTENKTDDGWVDR